MKLIPPFTRIKLASLALLLTTVVIQGCNDDALTREYNVTVTNLTNNQAFSPIAGVMHDDSQEIFELGNIASVAVENLAESGDNSGIVDDTDSTASGSGLLTAGSSETIALKSDDKDSSLSLLAMLVNTNDGFIGLKSVDLAELKKDESLMLYARVYDAGTEKNSEASTDVPGQSGEGFNAERNDHNFISVHPGVISQDDGFTSSALDASHRFDNPGAKVVITRTR